MGLDPEEDSLVRLLLRAATLGGVVALVITGSSSVLAEGDGGGASHAVFVETNGTSGNAILA